MTLAIRCQRLRLGFCGQSVETVKHGHHQKDRDRPQTRSEADEITPRCSAESEERPQGLKPDSGFVGVVDLRRKKPARVFCALMQMELPLVVPRPRWRQSEFPWRCLT